jgi:hypothetical protein
VRNGQVEDHIWANKCLGEKPIANLDWILFENHTAWSRILRRGVFYRAIQHIDKSLYINNGEDFLIFTIAKYYVRRYININEKFYYYVVNEDSVTNTYDEVSIANHFSQKTLAFQTLINILTKKIGYSFDLNKIYSFYTSVMSTWRKRLITSNPFINEIEKMKLLEIFYENIDMKMISESTIDARDRLAEKRDELIRDRDRIAEEKGRRLKKYIQVERNSILGFIVMITSKLLNVLSFK